MFVRLMTILCFVGMLSATNCNNNADRNKIDDTMAELISILRDGNDVSKFEKLSQFEIENGTKTKEMVQEDYQLYSKIVADFRSAEMKYYISDSLDPIGRLKVILPLKHYKDSLDVSLVVFFGPPYYVPLDRLSGYYLDTDFKKLPKLEPL